MNMIRPVSDLRNNFADISRTVHETAQPVFLTKNGYGDMVVLSMEAFENLQFESEVYFKLQEAEREAELTERLEAGLDGRGEVLSQSFSARESGGALYVTLRAECLEDIAAETKAE